MIDCLRAPWSGERVHALALVSWSAPPLMGELARDVSAPTCVSAWLTSRLRGRSLPSCSIVHRFDALFMGAMCAAKERAAGLYAVTYDLAAAMLAFRRYRMNGTFKTIEI